MWIHLGGDYVNLNNLAAITFGRDGDGLATVRCEAFSGGVKRYKGPEVEEFRKLLEAMVRPPHPGSRPPPAGDSKS